MHLLYACVNVQCKYPMAKTISRKRVLADLENLKRKEERHNYTFRFNKRLYEAFRVACGSRKTVRPSNVLEALMRAFIEDSGAKLPD